MRSGEAKWARALLCQPHLQGPPTPTEASTLVFLLPKRLSQCVWRVLQQGLGSKFSGTAALRACGQSGLKTPERGARAQPLTWTLPPSPRLKPESQGPPARLGLTAGMARSVGSSSREQSGRRSTPVTLGWGHRHTQHPSQLLCLREQLLLHCSASLCQLELVVKKNSNWEKFSGCSSVATQAAEREHCEGPFMALCKDASAQEPVGTEPRLRPGPTAS